MVTSEVTLLKPRHWGEGTVSLLDQTRLPAEEVWLDTSDYREVVFPIQKMRVRGAPAIGIAGADAVALAATELESLGADDFMAPLVVAAPTSTTDTDLPNGDAIPIEECEVSEVTHLGGRRIAAEGVSALNPAFDITHSKYGTAIVIEQKVLRAPYGPAIAATMETRRD